MQTVVNRLRNQRMVRNFPPAAQVFRTRQLIGENQRDQIFGVHTNEPRRHLAPASKALDGECTGSNPAPAHRKNRRVEQCLREYVPHGIRIQVTPDLFQRKAVYRSQ